MAAGGEASSPPEEFARALRSLRGGPVRPEVRLATAPAPSRLAPSAAALTAEVPGPDDTELANGRLVLLHDPRGVDAWSGRFRIVTYVSAAMEREVLGDPLLPSVGWTWLTESLERHSARYVALAGTVTRTSSEGFGEMADRVGDGQVEIRASWTPLPDDFGAHQAAWADVLCATAGLPPLPDGVVALTRRRPAGG